MFNMSYTVCVSIRVYIHVLHLPTIPWSCTLPALIIRMYTKCGILQRNAENHMSTAAAGSEEQEEAVLRLAVANVSRLEEVAFSKPTALRNHLW